MTPTTGTGPARLQTTGLAGGYRNTPIFSDIHLTANPGELTGLLGPNGSGKSTVLKTLVGVLRPTSGTVCVDGQDIRALTRRQRAQLIGYLPQATDAPFPLTVHDYVQLGRTPHAELRTRATDRRITLEVLNTLNIAQLALRPFRELSSGQRQAVTLARALVTRPAVLLLDEPTSALDLHHQLHALDQIRTHLTRTGAAAIMAIHDLNLAARYCHQLTVIAGGHIHTHGPPHQVLTPDMIRDVYGVHADIDTTRPHPVVIPLNTTGPSHPASC